LSCNSIALTYCASRFHSASVARCVHASLSTSSLSSKTRADVVGFAADDDDTPAAKFAR